MTDIIAADIGGTNARFARASLDDKGVPTLGTVRKYIPYGDQSDNGYHIPFCIYQMLKDRQFLNIRTGKDRRGQVKVEQGMAREFAIEVLEQLTPEELYKLGQAQIAAGSTDS